VALIAIEGNTFSACGNSLLCVPSFMPSLRGMCISVGSIDGTSMLKSY
jgi:hypothetical protein